MSKSPPKEVRSTMETKLLTRNETQAWQVPHFQRPIRVNGKVRGLAEALKTNGGIVSGIVTLGKVNGDKTQWLVDGQHRREGFLISELPECIMDVRICEFDSMAELAAEFVQLNSKLVNMRPDDILRGMEANIKCLRMIREACDFVGYGSVRREGTANPILSMSVVLKCWRNSSHETPSNMGGTSALHLAEEMEDTDAFELIKFLQVARSAWSNDPEYYKLWGSLNLTLCMWMWRVFVLDKDRSGRRSSIALLSPEQFRKCLMAISASPNYIDWLTGRKLSERDRSPCWTRLKAIFLQRLQQDSGGKVVKLIKPSWSSE